MANSVTIVVPVYADWPSLKNCIESLLENVDFGIHKLLLVNDCGPEADYIEDKIKGLITGRKGLDYYRNSKNLGFVGTCNRAVNELDKSDNDVLLLNSDARTTKGFLEELIYVLDLDEKHGAVSPRSNNATLATIPISSAPQKGLSEEESYAQYLSIKDKLPRYTIAPVAHGFCILIKRSLISQYGLFDEAFGKGYGEEVDFCRRIKSHGYLSLISNRSYVYHLEAKSFTIETKMRLIEKSNQIIWSRYPEYRQEVREYMADQKDIEEALLSKGNPAKLIYRIINRDLTRLYRRARRLFD